MKKISILYWQHALGAVEGPAKLIGNGLAEHGYDVQFVNVSEQNTEKLGEELKTLITQPISLILSITAFPLSLKIGDRELVEFLTSPIAILSVDAPVGHPEKELLLFNKLPQGSIYMTIDAIYAKQMRGFLNNRYPDKFKVIFFPFGGPAPVSGDDKEQVERSLDLVIFANADWPAGNVSLASVGFSGVFPDLSNTRFENKRKVIVDIAESLIKGSYNFDLQGELIKILDLEPLFYNIDDSKFLASFDFFVKKFRRQSLLRALLLSEKRYQLNIAIFGSGWEEAGTLPPNWQICGLVPYDTQFEIFKLTKFVLNLDPNWTYGVHDRVFNALGMGAAVITNENHYSKLLFHDGIDAILFDHTSQVSEKLFNGLRNWSKIAENGKENFLLSMTWKDRCAPLIKLLEQSI
jgi:spore maturation protein CgeB